MLDRGDDPERLTGGSYFCDPDTFVDGGLGESDCTLIHWTHGETGLVVPGGADRNGINR